MVPSNVHLVRAAYEAFAAGDMAPLVDLLDDDVEWIEPDGAPGVGGTYHGRESVLGEMFARLPSVWDDFRVAPTTYVDGGEHVLVLGDLSAHDPLSGMPAHAPFAHVWRLQAGKAVWWRCYEDTALLHEARRREA